MDLPDELWLLIFTLGCFGLKTRAFLANVCQKWRRILSDRSLWRGERVIKQMNYWGMDWKGKSIDHFGDDHGSLFHLRCENPVSPGEVPCFEWFFSLAESASIGLPFDTFEAYRKHVFPFLVLGLPDTRVHRLELHKFGGPFSVTEISPDLIQRLQSFSLSCAKHKDLVAWYAVIQTMPRLTSLFLDAYIEREAFVMNPSALHAFSCLRRLHVQCIDNPRLMDIAERAGKQLTELKMFYSNRDLEGRRLAQFCPNLTCLYVNSSSTRFLAPLVPQLTWLHIEDINIHENDGSLANLVLKLPSNMIYCHIVATIVPKDRKWTWTHLLKDRTLRSLDLDFRSPNEGAKEFHIYIASFKETHSINDVSHEYDLDEDVTHVHFSISDK